MAKPPRTLTLSRYLVWLMLTEPDSARSYRENIYRKSALIAATAPAVREFARIVRSHDLSAWPALLHSVLTTGLSNFAAHLIRDQDEGTGVFEYALEHGPVEG
jgi:hypothetical protein